MAYLALITWVLAVLGGLFLLVIWLIEYDPDFQKSAATRLPVPVVCTHVLLAVGGLVVWIIYLFTDKQRYAWTALIILGVVVSFGLTMAVRWVGVYRARPAPTLVPSGYGGGRPVQPVAVPPERHFPVTIVVAHGLFAFTTVALVLLTDLGIGGS